MAQNIPLRILRRPEVEAKTGLCRSSIYQLISNNQFPKPIKLSSLSRGWVESEIDDWISQRMAARDAA